MRIRFSCVAFVPPDKQLGVTGGPSFLGRWDPSRCVALGPYQTPSQNGSEPSLWFADVEVDERTFQHRGASVTTNQAKCPSEQWDSFQQELIAAVKRTNSHLESPIPDALLPKSVSSANPLARNGKLCWHINLRAPSVVEVLEKHPLRNLQFEYKFVMWTPDKPPEPYTSREWEIPNETNAPGGSWLTPPKPCFHPPPLGADVLWEGNGPESNRKFIFDPSDVVLDDSSPGLPEVLYITPVCRFRDPREGPGGESSHTTRFYHAVKSEGRMHYSRILPKLFVGSCPRQLQHIRHLKQNLKVTAIFNLQTQDDIMANYPDPLADTRSPEAVCQMYDSAGIRYVWLPVEDMNNASRKLAVAQCACILNALLQIGHCVYVHCNAGVGRSVAAVCAYLCFCLGLDLRKVNFLVNARRPVAYWDEKAMKYGLIDYQAKFGSMLWEIPR